MPSDGHLAGRFVLELDGEAREAYSERNARQMMEQLGLEERGPKGVDLVVEASGAEVSIQTGILIAKQGGSFVQVRAFYFPSSLLSVVAFPSNPCVVRS